jgi:diphosphomevalonate decarboxylase
VACGLQQKMKTSQKNMTGRIAWRSPSNIALIKYWGKRPVQIPANPSLSMTLSRAYTEMALEYFPKEEGAPFLEFLFEGRQNGKFADKISYFLHSLAADFPEIENYTFKVTSSNTFPHSTGIASSASSMSALGLCVAEFLSLLNGTTLQISEASRLSRLASGSASRSVYGGFVIWGKIPEMEETSDEFAVPFPYRISPVFSELKDAILVVSSKEKDVSSRAGHSLMDSHPYSQKRYQLASANLLGLSEALKTGDVEQFVRITESEALNLHALMLSSPQAYLLFEPGTIQLIKAVRQFRKETSLPVCFTLDAGPNVHLIYPKLYQQVVTDWISHELSKYCENGRWIDDEIGNGPEKI